MAVTKTDLDHFYQFATEKIGKGSSSLTLADLVAQYEQGRKFDETVSSISADIDEVKMGGYRVRDDSEDQRPQF